MITMMTFFIKHYGCYFDQILMADYCDNVTAVDKSEKTMYEM